MNVEIAIYEGFDELDAVGPYEVLANGLRYAADEGSVRMVTRDGRDAVTASHGLRVGADGELGGSDPDLVVVPGGGWSDPDAEAGARAEYDDGRLPDRLAALYAEGVPLATVCTGAMLAAKTGLFDGKPAVTHASALDDLADAGADVREARVVDTGDLLSAGGVTSGLDLAFHVVDREFGADVAERVAREMEYEPSGDVVVV
ncbi:DJ-1/PfpI family protein [Halosegnis marinus]|uniref:DJ-1/PfpI family protein n=1 Tax=Halosegnis marinus TaxID=3034023 RepID=A0ABD5ZMP1_9EURY|nr:DJ-1/PfpI family protein [Halosegnis sp. DT85]